MSDNSSENSLAKNELSSDFNVKYNRLAIEYSKLRAQNAVLKKAVIDEQARNAEINEVVRSKDQIIRKIDQEMEALKFRNSQLSVRLSVLQEEIEVLNNKHGKKKSKQAKVPNGVCNMFDAEVEKMMMEHAKMISDLTEEDAKHSEEVKLLKNEIYSLKYELEQKDAKLKQLADDQLAAIEIMKQDQKEMNRNYSNKVVKLREVEVELTALKKIHKSYIDDVMPKLEILTYLLPKKIPFLDEEHEILNELNANYEPSLYTKDCYTQVFRKSFNTLLLAFYNVIHNVTVDSEEVGFSELKFYMKSLLTENDGILLNDKLKVCNNILNNIRFTTPDPNNMQCIIYQFSESFVDLLNLFHSRYMNGKRRQLYGITNDTENGVIKDALEILQMKKNELVKKVITLPNYQHSLIHHVFENFNNAFKSLISAANDVDGNRSELAGKTEDKFKFKKRAALYLCSLNKEPSERISFEESRNNKIKLQEYAALNNVLKGEIKNLECTIASLEQEKHRNQYDDQLEEIKSLYSQLSSIAIEGEGKSCELTRELGKFTSPLKIPAEIQLILNEIQRRTVQKLHKLVIEKQDALSKARSYVLECKALQRRIEYCQVEKQIFEHQCLKLNETSSEVKEELNVVRQNYEIQLSMMSVHLANVNEKLATQTEEIEKLQYQLGEKVLKKNKTK